MTIVRKTTGNVCRPTGNIKLKLYEYMVATAINITTLFKCLNIKSLRSEKDIKAIMNNKFSSAVKKKLLTSYTLTLLKNKLTQKNHKYYILTVHVFIVFFKYYEKFLNNFILWAQKSTKFLEHLRLFY